jgi:hypothetical protein
MRTDTAEFVAPGHVRLSSSCWSCDGVTVKQVPWRNRGHAHFQWSCPSCDVSWAGPGEPA